MLSLLEVDGRHNTSVIQYPIMEDEESKVKMQESGQEVVKTVPSFGLIIQDEVYRSKNWNNRTSKKIRTCRAAVELAYKPQMLFLSRTALQDGPKDIFVMLYNMGLGGWDDDSHLIHLASAKKGLVDMVSSIGLWISHTTIHDDLQELTKVGANHFLLQTLK